MALMTYDEFEKKYLGKAVDYDGVLGIQCADLFDQYLKDCFGITGVWCDGAKDLYNNFNSYPALVKAFERVANTRDLVVTKGDVVIWGGGSWGHVGIGNGVGDKDYFVSLEENTLGKYEPTQLVKHYFNGVGGNDGCNPVLGVLRPKTKTQTVDKKTTTDNGTKTKSTTLKGIDISRYQGKPDFSKVKNDVDYVVLQAGYGRYVSQIDTEFERGYSECKKHGIPVGAYWFSYAKTTAEALAEANACIEIIKGKQFEYPIYYDLEIGLDKLGKSLVSSIATTFCNALEKAGYYTGIYISRSPAQLYLTKEVAQRYALWLAEYNSKCNYDGTYGMWQYSSTGRVSGISGDVDMDYCYVNYPTIIKNAGLNGYSKPEPTPIPQPTPEKKELDTNGYKEGDKGYQALALKTLLKLAIDKGIVSGKLDNTTGLGGGSIKVVNALLKKWGYKENGIAGTNFINRIYKELK